MSIELQKLTESEFKEYREHLVSRFTEDSVTNGDWTEEEAKNVAEMQLKSILPEGVATPNHFIFSVFHQKLNMAVGNVWIQIQNKGTVKKGILFDLTIFDMFKNKDFDKQTLQVSEEWLKTKQVKSLELHVYATNPSARKLYVDFGLTDFSFNMVKSLSSEKKEYTNKLILEKMTESEFKPFINAQIIDYAHENVEAGYWAEEESEEKSKKEIERLLPDGLETKDHYIFSVVDQESNEHVGALWVYVAEKKKLKSAFIYYIEIFENYRGKGLSKQTLALLDQWCVDKGILKIGLHVFAKNIIARNVYKKFGYKDINYNMGKEFS